MLINKSCGRSESDFSEHNRLSRADNNKNGPGGLGLSSVAWVAAAILFGVTAPSLAKDGKTAAASAVDESYILKNAKNTKEWPSHGLDYAETRFSRLNQINDKNVNKIGPLWSYNLNSQAGVEVTPLVVDGVMYVTASWSIVHALDARTGKKLWTYDPEVPRSHGFKGCCDVVNRGVALHKGKVFVGTYDGRLVALDAGSGKKLWEVDTISDSGAGADHSYTITGAPRVIKGKVIIGNGGAEYGVRGYITAYDAETGKKAWRWYTVPGDPDKPYENEAMKEAAKTWDPSGRYWELGGGGTVWNSIVFDPELDLMYFGTGNGSPWSHHKRSPKGGDNLYLASIVALKPDTGEYVWHYQETPGDNWDYTSTQDLILADLKIGGKKRKVILHAPKNGFFFVVDRTNGEFISAKNFVDVNWATGYDDKGRPIENPETRSIDKAYDIVPGPFGGHNWHSMSFNTDLGLAYIPAQNVPLTLAEDDTWTPDSHDEVGQVMAGTGWNTARLLNSVPPTSKAFGRLVAWDPVQQKEAWRQDYDSPWNGGTLTTAGNLVFQGTADGRFVAYDAANGKKLWESETGTGVVAAPMTYEIDGKQYVSIAVGWGGVYGKFQRATDYATPGAIYTYALDASQKLPEFTRYPMSDLLSGVKYDPADVEEGTALYVSNCLFCHGVPGVDRGGNIRNLGYVGKGTIENLDKFVFKGPMASQGMPDFTGKLTGDNVNKIKAFIQATAEAVAKGSGD